MVVEPGAFRTRFFDDSLKGTNLRIADYEKTAGTTRKENIVNYHDQPGDAVKVQLYRQKTKLDGYTVKLKVVVEGIEVKNASIVVKKNTSVTIKQDVWNRDYKITVGGIIEDLKSENGTVSYTIDNVSGDMDITIASDDQHWGNDFEFSNCQKATQYIETGTQSLIIVSIWSLMLRK